MKIRFLFAFIAFVFLPPLAFSQAPAEEQAHSPLQTDGRWLWTKEAVQTRLEQGLITQEQANEVLAADGGVCADQASATPVNDVHCESQFVFECVDLPQVGFSECSTALRAPNCSDEDAAAVQRLQEAAFTNCMLDVGWQRQREARAGE